MLEQLPLALCVGRTIVGGIDLNKTRMRRVVDAAIALSASPTALPPPMSPLGYVHSATNVARATVLAMPPCDLKKLRAEQIFCRIGRTRRYQPLAGRLRAIAALVILRNKAIRPILAAARSLRPTRGHQTPNRSMPTTRRCALECTASRELGIAA